MAIMLVNRISNERSVFFLGFLSFCPMLLSPLGSFRPLALPTRSSGLCIYIDVVRHGSQRQSVK